MILTAMAIKDHISLTSIEHVCVNELHKINPRASRLTPKLPDLWVGNPLFVELCKQEKINSTSVI